VHFVPTRDGIPVDCDGRFERFARNLHDAYNDDLRYVVEKYFEQVLTMIECGGFDILGHLDKISANAAKADPDIENTGWYKALIEDVINHAASSGLTVEINTKSYNDTRRFFPALQWWTELLRSGAHIVINSDAHYPDKVNAGRPEALRIIEQLKSGSIPSAEI
ncbi:MAG: histidinol-phosphatase, partial [Muribaculaceae bacterium]|nr:histidinol-phosphatase [Muribaculaceae bacterium]